ncbi:protein split ends isoform X3 [Atheta coriaria]|uniref:protein split ends isoform X3 n=1 Tax=Dalotia coriaria TaxID=877792 RepID=UPI0031F3FA0B
MVRETRHLWVGNLPDNIREDRIREHFKRYGRVQSVKLLPRSGGKEETSKMACTVAFMDIKSASKAHTADHKLDDRTLTTEYYEPAAIPSSSSPPNAAAGYSTTSPSSTRFPNGHSSSDEHGNFTECFYDRTNNSRQQGGDGEYIRRPPSYHDNGRGRNRDRGFRNGPPYKLDTIIDRHRPANNSWSTYESNNTRYNNQANDTGYSTTPTDTSSNNDRRSEQSTKKKTKSGSGSRTPSPSGSASSRSPSRSRSRSSSSSSSSSVSRGTSSTGSPKSRRLPSSAPNQSIVHSEDRRPLAICVRNLPLRSSDTSLKDGLFHEYKKHGKVTWVKVVGQNSERHAIVCFKKPEDVDKAIEVSYDKLFFGHKIEVAPYQGYDVEDNDLRPYEAEIDEYHPKATRTLFIGNLEKDVTPSDLRKHFDTFGEIIEIDIKKQGSASSYAFCQYSDIVSVVKAIRTMDGEHLNNNRIKLGFGKSMPTACVWVDGVSDSVNEKYLNMQFDPFGNVGPTFIDREKGQALIFFDQVMNAQAAVNKTRGVSLRGRRIQVDFASRECQEAFFERLEKQGLVFEKPVDDRRDVIRGFDNIGSGRFSRYETPTRPRTASYSGRSGGGPGAGSCQTGAIPSPGTPGSATPRGTGSRSRVPRYEYYEQQNNSEYNERHFRNYDEYSQGSAASHEDTYEHEYPYHESPSHVDPIDVRVVNDPSTMQPFAQPDIRNLQKERVHLLEQLEDCHSSGDEVISPKKRLKLDHLEASNSDVIIEANRDHRKVTEVRRTSDASVKHLSRRPSVDSGKHVAHERGTYLPHAVCKRRKTAGSDSGRAHHYESSESVGGSRPGTPLCDERPEHFAPTEPRRTPREREGPLTLPLPRFASQMIGRASVSVAGIKGQKENVLSSPPAAVTSPRISNPKPPSPTPVPPPASPPPRPPSLSSNSSDSDGASISPSLDERIKSLDEKYEKWSGSRATSTAGLEALAKLDTTSQRFRLTRNLLDLDLREVQPSEIVKSVMAKRSVFDEDSKRLENVGEKYEPKEFNSVLRVPPVSVQTTVPATTLSTLPLLKVCTTPIPKTPTMLSPRSSGAALTPAKGLQYPFPSHPPMQPSPSSSTPTTSPASQPPPSNTTPLLRSAHGDNRLKSCANAPNDGAWTPSKVNRNVSTGSAGVASKACDVMVSSVTVAAPAVVVGTTATTTNSRNIPACSATATECATTSTTLIKTTVCARVVSSTRSRRDSTISSNSSSENKSRRNSVNDNCDSADGNARVSELDLDYGYLNSPEPVERLDEVYRGMERFRETERERKKERERDQERELERLEQEKERFEKERTEKEWLEREEKERAERLERERQEKERSERLERERLEKERTERLERERLEKERFEREEKERREREEKERREENERREEKERQERERREREEKERREREEKERQERVEQEEKERREQEDREREHLERERRERREKEEKERREREEREKKEELDRLEKERRRLDKDDERKHKEDNHDSNKKNDHRHTSRDNHSEPKHNRENNVSAASKEQTERIDKGDKKDNHISSRNVHDKNRCTDRRDDLERRKESVKENRENNQHEKAKNLFNEIRETKDRPVEVHHTSLDATKFDSKDPTRRKERVNSLPATLVGTKRRISSHDSLDSLDETKKIKIEHRSKISERRDSKEVNTKKHSKNSSTSAKVYDEKTRHNHVKDATSGNKEKEKDKDKEKEREREERHKNKARFKLEQKSKSKSRDKESPGTPKSPTKELDKDKDLLARFELAEVEKQKQQQRNKEIGKDERKSESRGDEIRIKKDYKCNRDSESSRSGETPSKDPFRQVKEEKTIRRIRKVTLSSDNSDSDEPKKHSIFDIVDDEPAYISMYDKVKARSCKNMQKQEEEKRQKIKAKFSQLKQSRAKREEKKRSTSWDEDSDSDIEKYEYRRKGKVLLASTDDDDDFDKPIKKEFSDSDSDRNRQPKSIAESSEDDIKNLKQPKSRITSDTSDDDMKLPGKVKTEDFSDNEDQGFADSEEKYSKKIDFDDRYLKKERKNNKHGDMLFDLDSPPLESKEVKFNNSNRMYDSSEGESVKMEVRKKHRKKQKRSKNSTSGEESSKVDGDSHDKQGEKRKQHSKKDKKRDKTKDERVKKSKKNRSDSKEFRRDGKMENIFGSLSDDSDVQKEADEKIIFVTQFSENNDTHAHLFASDSDNPPTVSEPKSPERSQLDKERSKVEEKDRFKEEHRKRKERKRRDKEKRLREEQQHQQLANDNSIDYSDLGKQLEDNIKDDSDPPAELKVKTEIEESRPEADEVFRYIDVDEKTGDRKENKEKKKKRKKSKDEKQRHHHHHHHDKNKPKTPEFKKEVMLLDVPIKTEIKEESTPTPVSGVISIFDAPNFDRSISPQPKEPLISPIPKTPTSSKDKKRDKFIAGFGVDIDEKIHENANAVKSISELVESPKVEPSPVPTSEDEIKSEVPEQPVEEKPPRIISQEETEDAVAALLGESFGSGQFDDYDPQSPSGLDSTNNETQDDEEMLQAVQSLNSSEMEQKPETPQSESELQIDTDTEEQEDVSIRYDTPKTPDMLDYSQPPKTPDISPSYFRKESADKSMPSIGSPPSLTPIKPITPTTEVVAAEVKRNLDVLQEPKKPLHSLPIIATTSTWTDDDKPDIKSMPPLAISMQQKPAQPLLPPSQSQQHLQPSVLLPVKEETPKLPSPPPLKPVTKLPVTTHNMPAQLPSYPVSKEMKPSNRLPITPVVVAKSTQPTTHVLPQPKVAQTEMIPQYLHGQFPPRTILQRPPLIRSNVYMPNTYDKPPTMGPELPKLASLSTTNLAPRQGWPVSQTGLPKLVPTTPTCLSTTLPPSNQVPAVPSIVVSHSSTKQAPSSPFMPVIQEGPKLSSQVPTQSSQPITTSHQTSSPSTIIQKTPSEEEIEEEPKDLLKVKETPRTSTPSPVIVAPVIVKDELKLSPVPAPNVITQDHSKALPIETVTEELNLTLKKSEEPVSEQSKVVKPLVKEEPTDEDQHESPPATVPTTSENVSVIKETEKFDEEKIIEPLKEKIKIEELEVVNKPEIVKVDQNEDSKEDGDYWPAEINIDSVIRKVDALCSADLSDRGNSRKKEWSDEKPEPNTEEKLVEDKDDELEELHEFHETDVSVRGKRGGRARGKARGGSTRGGVQTRRGKAVPSSQVTGASTRGRGRGGRTKTDRKVTKSESDDVYEFRDDSDENKDRPRLIMTIKGAGPSGPAVNLNAPTTLVKELVVPAKKAASPLPMQTTPSSTPTTSLPQQSQPITIQLPQPEVPSPSPPQVVPQSSVVQSSLQSVQPQQPLTQQPSTIIPVQTPGTCPTSMKIEVKEEFACLSNTRKSQRLRERDVSRNTVDDTIEDVIKNTVRERDVPRNTVGNTIEDVVKNTVLTRAAAAAAAVNAPRRSLRQTVGTVKASNTAENRKSPRGGKKEKKDRRPSETTDDSSEESLKTIKNEQLGVSSKVDEGEKEVVRSTMSPATTVIEQSKLEVREKPHEGLKAAMLRRVKGEMQQQAQQQHSGLPNSHESMTLIDPVTGLLTPMRECEEGRYIPLAGQKPKDSVITTQQKQQSALQTQPPQQQASSVLVKQKPQSLKARVLNAQQQQLQQQQLQVPSIPALTVPVQVPSAPASVPITTTVAYQANKPLNLNVTLPYDIPAHTSPRQTAPHSLTKPIQGVKVIQPPLSPSVHTKQQPQHQHQQIIQQVVASKQQQAIQQAQQLLAKGTPIVQLKHTQLQQQQQQQQLSKSPILKHVTPTSSQSMVATPPVKQQHIMTAVGLQRVATKTVMEPPKVEVSIASGCVMVPRSNASPQGRHVIPVPAYEASMQHGETRRRSPPPAHQNSPSPQGEGIAHYTPSVRLPHDIHSHYIHPSLYQQYMRQQPYHLQRSLGIEKSADGQEGEEAPVTSPPLEMRRPGSVGIALTGRSNVPHSLQSPLQDRSTESPQIGQAYGIHSNRVPHQLGRYYASQEPPPAHRPLTSHGSLAALGSERSLGHMGALPDRPLSTHSALASHIERPLSIHTPDRPMSTHIPERMSSLGLGAVLGAAGNIMGAVARHVGDAPASQRGIQAATPPHASQVPPQAESLLMLLKQYPLMWQGLLALKNDQAAVQMYFVSGNDQVAKMSLPKNIDGSTPPLRIFQRMRLEPPQVEGVARKMQMENEHCMLLALPCGHDHMDVLKQSTNLTNGFITYLQHKQAAGIVNVAAPGTTQPPAYVVHIFPSCDFVNENLRRIAPSLLERVADIAHLLIVITTV